MVRTVIDADAVAGVITGVIPSAIAGAIPGVISGEHWVPFPGGELEGQPPRALCPACREALRRGGPVIEGRRPLCFQCYREEVRREAALAAAATLDTASNERFQQQLPLEPVNRARLSMLRAERATTASAPGRQMVDRRRHAQIRARHALERIAVGLRQRGVRPPGAGVMAEERALNAPIPESWRPFAGGMGASSGRR